MSEEDASDIYRKISVGDVVRYGQTPTFDGEACGIVMRARDNSVDLMLVTAGGIDYRRDVWYLKDPRVQKHKNLYYTTGLMRDRGIFDVTDQWRLLRRNIDLAETLLPLIEGLLERVKKLEAAYDRPGAVAASDSPGVDPEDRGSESCQEA